MLKTARSKFLTKVRKYDYHFVQVQGGNPPARAYPVKPVSPGQARLPSGGHYFVPYVDELPRKGARHATTYLSETPVTVTEMEACRDAFAAYLRQRPLRNIPERRMRDFFFVHVLAAEITPFNANMLNEEGEEDDGDGDGDEEEDEDEDDDEEEDVEDSDEDVGDSDDDEEDDDEDVH